MLILRNEIPAEFLREFDSFIHKKTSPLRGFAEALALRGQALTPLAKTFSEYFISRALYEAGMIEVAANGFNVLTAAELVAANADNGDTPPENPLSRWGGIFSGGALKHP